MVGCKIIFDSILYLCLEGYWWHSKRAKYEYVDL